MIKNDDEDNLILMENTANDREEFDRNHTSSSTNNDVKKSHEIYDPPIKMNRRFPNVMCRKFANTILNTIGHVL